MHVLLVVLFLQLSDEQLLLVWIVWILLFGILLKLHCRLCIQNSHDLLSVQIDSNTLKDKHFFKS